MPTGRTHEKHVRAYVDGVDMSGYTRTIGPLSVVFDVTPEAALSEAVKGVLCGHATISPGTLNGLYDTRTAGLHAVLSSPGQARAVLVAVGMRADPVLGDIAFCGNFPQTGYPVDIPREGAFVASVPFGPTNVQSGQMAYSQPWGVLLHALGAETAANSGSGVDNAAASAGGGFFTYHLTSSNGTLTLSVDDSANGSSWSALSGATSGSITAAVTPAHGLVALATTATVRRYLRWQIALGTATTASFVCAFVRG